MDQVLLDIPASVDLLHVVRAVVSGVAASRGLSYEAIDTICLTASEAAGGLLAGAGESQRLRVRLGGEGSIAITLTVESNQEGDAQPGPITWDPLSWRILSSLADRVEALDEDGVRGIRIVLRT